MEMSDHRPLRGAANETGMCTGNDQPFAIQRHLDLGHEITTDVFEFQAATDPGISISFALVIAFREAICARLGVETSDVGFTIARHSDAEGRQTHSHFLFDNTPGGGGFSVQAEDFFDQVLERACDFLDCPTPGCQTGCTSCVIVKDLPRDVEIDRTAALEFLKENFGS